MRAVRLETQARLGDFREVGAALAPGDKVVLNPGAGLVDGTRVRVASAGK